MTGRTLILTAFLVAAACSPEGPSSPQNDAQEAAAQVGAASEAGAARPAEKAPALSQSAAGKGERRCGWLSNPTPGNWWLTDRDGEWVLATQGGEQAPGMDEMPDMSIAGWVETNGNYGYGCACVTIAHDPGTKRVTRIANAEPKPLEQCSADGKLPRPD